MVDLHSAHDSLGTSNKMGILVLNKHAPIEVIPENRVSVAIPQTKNKRQSIIISTSNRDSVANRHSVLTNRQSILANNPRVPPWEVIVDQNLTQCLRSAKYRDFTYFRLSTALNEEPDIEHVDHKATLFSLIENERPIERLEALNKSKCQLMQHAFLLYTTEIDRAKDEQLGWLDWGRMIDLEESRLMAMIGLKIKETNIEAKSIISDLPADCRDNAAGIWVQGSSVAMSIFRTICTQISSISGRVGEFERGNFDIIESSDEKVKDAYQAAVESILSRPEYSLDVEDE